MRIPSGVVDQVIYFVAVDATDLKTRETGLTAFTAYRDRNGGGAAAMTTPTVTEVDAVNMPGVYKLLCDEDMTIGAGNDSEEMAYHITQAAMAPVTRVVEIYRRTVTAGNTLGVAADGDVSGNIDGAVASVTAAVTAGTVSDKTGYSISGTKQTLDALNDVTAAGVNAEVLDVMSVDTFGEPAQGAPGATVSIVAKINYIYKILRNKKTSTATTISVYDAAGTTVDHKRTISDDGTTYTEEEIVAGP